MSCGNTNGLDQFKRVFWFQPLLSIVNDNELWKFLDLAILVFGFNCYSVTLFNKRITAYLRTT